MLLLIPVPALLETGTEREQQGSRAPEGPGKIQSFPLLAHRLTEAKESEALSTQLRFAVPFFLGDVQHKNCEQLASLSDKSAETFKTYKT